jgi:hypothetical protein
MHSKETVEILRAVLDEAWASLTPTQQMSTRRSDMAAAILHAAAQGERDPLKLKDTALGAREIVLQVA